MREEMYYTLFQLLQVISGKFLSFILELDTRHVEHFYHKGHHSIAPSSYFFFQHNLRYHRNCQAAPGPSLRTLPQYDFPAISRHLEIWLVFIFPFLDLPS